MGVHLVLNFMRGSHRVYGVVQRGEKKRCLEPCLESQSVSLALNRVFSLKPSIVSSRLSASKPPPQLALR